MRRLLTCVAAALLLTVACSNTPDGPVATSTPEAPPLELTSGELDDSVLSLDDVGEKWKDEEGVPSTVLIGGDVGPANIDEADVDATSSFVEKDGTGYLSNTLLVLDSEALARAVMAAHEEADATERWVQERTDGGGGVYRRTGRVANIPNLGDETYTAALTAKITDADGNQTTRRLEYVAYRIRNLVAFVVTQDARAAVYARRQEANVSMLIS
jgi:hypothetical protein